jgi:hypothetical protein
MQGDSEDADAPGGGIRRKTNRRHMIGDHHGRTVRRATLLVTATDEIRGTHRTKTR